MRLYQLIYKILPLLVLSFYSIRVEARHIIGGEITYKYLSRSNGNINYRITMKVYRDCDGGGAQFDSAPGGVTGELTIYSGKGPYLYEQAILLSRPRTRPVDPNLKNPCLIIPPNVCVEEGVYEFDVALRDKGTSYWIVYQRCCRNNTINNLVNPGEVGATYYVEITPEAQALNNSSPVFTNFPEPVICVNEKLDFYFTTQDDEGDQLVYKWCNPLDGGTQQNVAPQPDDAPPHVAVPFKVPQFSAVNPLGVGVLTLGSFDGRITGRPTIQGQFVVAVCVEEYRNGKLLSTIQREFQFNVAFCQPTVAADLNAKQDAFGYYEFNTCGDTKINIQNKSQDPRYIKGYEWFFDLPDSVLVPNSFTTRDITLEVPGPGTYYGVMILNPGIQECTDTANIKITVATPIKPDFRVAFDTCSAGPVNFFDLTNTAVPVKKRSWIFEGTSTSELTNPTFQFTEPGSKLVKLNYLDSLGCSYVINKSFDWYPVPPVIVVKPSEVRGCPPLGVTFVNLSAPIDDTYLAEWDFGDGSTGEGLSPTHAYLNPGVYDVKVKITSPIGCVTDTTFFRRILIDTAVQAGFIWKPKVDPPSILDPEIQFIDQSKRAIWWQWSMGDGKVFQAYNPVYSYRDTGLMEVQLVVRDKAGCSDTLAQYIDILPLNVLHWPNAFTPNGDGLNEFFLPKGYFVGFKKFEFQIFNRWGQMIFESSDPTKGWDGKYPDSGQFAPAGTYAYRANLIDPRGKSIEFQGIVVLVK